jgi:hypothetical protein
MKFVFLLGGLFGFLVAGTNGWSADRAPDRVLFDAMIGCVVGATLFRWFWSVVLAGLHEAYVAKQQAALKARPVAAAPVKK